ncbi:hypothetical protein [Granulicella arctica]|uniref:hypothetical protein n=1 Tax=Granulicella arctica TaxID=940613 RepID=UPI0021DF8A94|nr:hypothetical protein [Granulicella arctica]
MTDYGMDALAFEEYGLGYRARLAGIMLLEGATPVWRSGWEDADTDRLESARHRKVVDEGLEDSYEAPGASSSTPVERHGFMGSASMRDGRSPGRPVG